MLSLDIASLQHGYATGTLSPEAVLDAVYDRIAARGERPVWITLLSRDAALAQLAAAPRGPLWGIPFAVKDNIDVAGLPTTAACPAFAYTPERSATVVERLQAAGAILIGKTNMDQFATGLVGTRSPYGACTSVFSADHISGGSSSGSGVAVGAGQVAFALGTDTAGSGRVPAAFNNVVGLKPTRGLVSTRGVVPACRSLDCVSVFAGTIGDALAVLRIAGGFDTEDGFSRRPQPAPALPARVRFGVPADLAFFGDTAAEVLFRESVARLEALGGEAVTIDFAPFRDAASLLYAGPWVAERRAAIGDFAATHPEAVHEVVRAIVLGGENWSAVDAFKAQYRLAELVRAAEAEWAKMDVLLLPTAPTIYRIDEVLADPVRLNSNLGTYTNFVNLMDLSAIAIPAGFRPDGLPFGVTLVGRAFEDEPLALLADALHRALPGARIGATGAGLATTPPARIEPSAGRVRLAVVGAHLEGQPLHGQLVERDARRVATTRTAPGYSLYALKGTTPAKPGLVRDETGAGGIEVEVYELDPAGFGSFVALVPPPLCIGTVTLADGSEVKGFLCEGRAVTDALDITALGGWRAWRASCAASS
ncbi:allophanate hydrolase [Blastochloris sulfoviridis]|uniref:Allophanate hydrolase n=1 Tax=Blastochloris sulfoviridis TaxID=50712 RepID=A0A5M6I399_9HYPH|nr:allophanate hydrolase [Blastochloris sulfoviridis]KAA5602676.1 allophanate hydrolase [Blastochloris sulfoviridis]